MAKIDSSIISSIHNPKVKVLLSLRRGRERVASRLMIVEGFEEITVAIRAGIRIHEIYTSRELMARTDQRSLLAESHISPESQFEVTPAIFRRIAYREGPDGWLAIATVPKYNLRDIELNGTPLILVIEGVEKPGNIGAMLRTAEAVGAQGVIVIDASTDIGNPNVVRASKGALFTLPVMVASLSETLAWLDINHIKLLAATPAAQDVYTQVSMTGPVAVAVGAEKPGLSDELMAAADFNVRIPMAGMIDSLNVSISAALMLYEAVRQRSPSQPH